MRTRTGRDRERDIHNGCVRETETDRQTQDRERKKHVMTTNQFPFHQLGVTKVELIRWICWINSVSLYIGVIILQENATRVCYAKW